MNPQIEIEVEPRPVIPVREGIITSSYALPHDRVRRVLLDVIQYRIWYVRKLQATHNRVSVLSSRVTSGALCPCSSTISPPGFSRMKITLRQEMIPVLNSMLVPDEQADRKLLWGLWSTGKLQSCFLWKPVSFPAIHLFISKNAILPGCSSSL